jgi:hypothetical protein
MILQNHRRLPVSIFSVKIAALGERASGLRKERVVSKPFVRRKRAEAKPGVTRERAVTKSL